MPAVTPAGGFLLSCH